MARIGDSDAHRLRRRRLGQCTIDRTGPGLTGCDRVSKQPDAWQRRAAVVVVHCGDYDCERDDRGTRPGPGTQQALSVIYQETDLVQHLMF